MMVSRRSLRRRRQLSTKDLLLLVESAAGLIAASLKVRFLPFRWITAGIIRRPVRQRSRPVDLKRIRWAIEAAGRRLPLRSACIESSLCFHTMLRRRGIGSVLHYGIKRSDNGDVQAHVWLSAAGQIVMGGEAARQFACVATFETGAQA